jgi:hypothetical protein
MADKDILADAQQEFSLCEEHESVNRTAFLDDIKFAKLGEQWPEAIIEDRRKENRPCLTVNRQPAFIRQVVNDARQNKPSIKVHPADSNADPETAEIYNGLIRNIEVTSKADVAYDTAFDFAVSGGFGYWRVNTDYSCDDTFDLDLRIERIVNPLSVYGDYLSTTADSSDWNQAFVTELLGVAAFEQKYKGAEKVDWEGDYAGLKAPWTEDKSILVAEWWTREKVKRPILALSDGTVVEASFYKAKKDEYDAAGITVMGQRDAMTHKVRQRVLTGAEVLEDNEWGGKYIPVVPVYGDEVNVEGKRYFRSLIRDAKDAQRMFNYWRTASTELVALAPRVPFIGPVGAFKTEAKKWATANTANHAYLGYDGAVAPQRQPLDGGRAAGALQEALVASDDMKAILGIYDAALGNRSNETSGVAIRARQREGDVSTFHFIDNLSRAIEHTGRILVDLIPTVYSGQRMLRVLGVDGSPSNVPLGQPVQQQGPSGEAVSRVYDLSRGKYDLTVETGPSFTTKREEAAASMSEFIQAFPAAAPVIGDLLAKNMDWPEADEVAKRLKAMIPAAAGANPELQKAQGEMQKLAQENQALKADRAIDMEKVRIDGFKAETERLKVIHEIQQPTQLPRMADAAPVNSATYR